ncbi:MAG: 3-dehydroquinate synthase [Clostridia bacterium BRH_c25]|nr:MAG: 3-dehydroquinate synthase [Clostridia bacterium BRH_c25]
MRTLEVSIKSSSTEYKIMIKKNAPKELYEYLAGKHKGKKAAIITDDNVNKLYGALLYKSITEAGLNCTLISVSPGEKSKSMEVLAGIYEALAKFNISRGDIIIAFGGGVVGDLTGFAAATYLRGVSYIQIPTTLLSQVDSSVGGKTAVDLPSGKNLVGSFYHPEIVFIDTMFLNTLEDRYLRDGMAEVIKYGCIKDSILFDRLLNYKDLQQCIDDMDELVYSCCSIKRAVVEADERDRGERMLLNFGHTLGHAVEQYYNYEKYTHGEAVAMGMAEITKRSEGLGLTEKGSAAAITEALKKYGLPCQIPFADKKKLAGAIKLDKKFNGDSIGLILLSKLGEAFIKKIKVEELESFI